MLQTSSLSYLDTIAFDLLRPPQYHCWSVSTSIFTVTCVCLHVEPLLEFGYPPMSKLEFLLTRMISRLQSIESMWCSYQQIIGYGCALLLHCCKPAESSLLHFGTLHLPNVLWISQMTHITSGKWGFLLQDSTNSHLRTWSIKFDICPLCRCLLTNFHPWSHQTLIIGNDL